ncbi:MAG: ferrous iron transport protein B [Alphaproteobacteria bacterium]|nr:ferrous iron transport protein B [Alphaproteobacteria bacterium]MCB9696478.1 ferrous iron transport protein B [Alphaproteobacteria bacterium]
MSHHEEDHHGASGARWRVVVAGNPNAGKSTLFNRLTGGSAHVGNFPGTTVGTTRGTLQLPGGDAELVDTPGTYSLAATSPDERVAMDALLGFGHHPRPDAVLLVVDGPRLLRSLYLVLQVLELGVPCVVAVNLLDEARAGGIEPRIDTLAEVLGVPVVGTVARSGEGREALVAALGTCLAEAPRSTAPHTFPPAAAADVSAVAEALPERLRSGDPARDEAVARWVLLSADESGRLPGDGEPLAVVARIRKEARAAGRDLDGELVAARYAWIDAHEAVFLGRGPAPARSFTERVDSVLLHPVFGSAIFVLVMTLAFTALFSWADPLIGLVESAMGALGSGVGGGFDAVAGGEATGWLGLLRDLLVDGVIGGVGAVLVFLPQIALLFLFLALLEDVGYLARAAHLADRVLRAAGLPGRAFVPLLSGYACAVPAILATRTLPRRRDRLLVMMVLPLTSCSARLPVYTLLIAALFPPVVLGFVPLQPLALAGMYLFSTAMAVTASLVLGNTVLAERTHEPVLLELPPYRVPDPRVVARVVWSRCRDFLSEAGGTILVATVVLWALTTFPRHTPDELLPEQTVAEARVMDLDLDALAAPLQLEQSYAGQLGRLIEPVISPLGYDWRIGIGLLGAFAAREVFVSTMGVVHGAGEDVDEQDEGLRQRIREARRSDGTPLYTPLVGASLMVFFALALQCLSTMAVLRKESGGWRWPALAFVWTGMLAWVGAFVVRACGLLVGLR